MDGFRHRIFLFDLVDTLVASGKFPTAGWQLISLAILEAVPIYTLTPRFIMSVRELYTRDIQGRCVSGFDSGFGLSLASRDAVGTAITFADIEENEVLGDVEEMPVEVRTALAE